MAVVGSGDRGKVRFPVVAGFERIQIMGDSLNSCESSYKGRRLCSPPGEWGLRSFLDANSRLTAPGLKLLGLPQAQCLLPTFFRQSNDFLEFGRSSALAPLKQGRFDRGEQSPR